MNRFYKVCNAVGERLGYVEAANEADAKRKAEAGRDVFDTMKAYTRHANDLMVEMGGLRVMPV